MCFVRHSRTNTPKNKTNNKQHRESLLAATSDARAFVVHMAGLVYALRNQHRLPLHRRHLLALESLQLYVPVASALGLGGRLREMEELSYRALFPDSYDRFFAWHREFSGLGQLALLRVGGMEGGGRGGGGRGVDVHVYVCVVVCVCGTSSKPDHRPLIIVDPKSESQNKTGPGTHRRGNRGPPRAPAAARALRDPGPRQVGRVGIQEGGFGVCWFVYSSLSSLWVLYVGGG